MSTPAKKIEQTKPKKVCRTKLSNFVMTAGNERKYKIVIDDGIVKEWVGIGWIECGKAKQTDYEKYPETY